MPRRKQSATAEHTLARTTRSAAAAEREPVLTFVPHQGLTSLIQVFQTNWLLVIKLTRLFQPRIAEPRPPKAGDKIKMSDFPRNYNHSDEETVIKTLVTGFQIIEKGMAPLLIDELAKFVVDTWKEDQRRGSERPSTPKEHRFYDIITSEDKTTRSLNYAYWFYLAAWYGPGHPDLKTILNHISVLWGVDFPTDAMFYPPDISDKAQKKLFAGIDLTLEHEGSGLPGGRPTPRPRAPSHLDDSTQPPAASKAQYLFESISQPRDAQMKARQKEIVNAIENNPVGSVLGKLVPNINPKFLKSTAAANDSNFGKLKSDLATTRKELQQSKNEVAILEKNLDSLQDAHHTTQGTLQQVQEKAEDLESGLERVQKNNKQLENQNTQLTERVDKLGGDLNRARKYVSDLEGKLSKAEDRMDSLETKLEEVNERAKKAIEMSAFNHALIEERIKEETHDEDNDEDEG
jgi:predicted nuclease with TOPRIM domain